MKIIISNEKPIAKFQRDYAEKYRKLSAIIKIIENATKAAFH